MDDQDNKKIEEKKEEAQDEVVDSPANKTEEKKEEVDTKEISEEVKEENKSEDSTAEEKEEAKPEENQEKENDVEESSKEEATEEKTTKDKKKASEEKTEGENSEEISEEIKRAKKLLAEDDPNDPAKWYIVHTYSGHENKVARSIEQRVQSLGYEKKIFEIIVPTRNTIKVTQGKKENVKEKIFPGYVLIKMILDNEAWLLVRTTQGVTSFIGSGNKPTPISSLEVKAIMKFMEEEQPMYKTTYTIGEAVKIVDGPFADFLGAIDHIDEQRGKLKVLVSIFGRETPVELDFLQVSKL